MHEDVESFGKFLFTLEWLLEVSARYTSNIQFNLVHIDFGNPGVLGDAYGAQEAAFKLHDALDVLRQKLRKTDLAARQGIDFWILMPSDPGNDALSPRLQGIIEAASESGLAIVERDISVFALGDAYPELGLSCSGRDFLSYLKRNHARLSLQEMVLPAQVMSAQV